MMSEEKPTVNAGSGVAGEADEWAECSCALPCPVCGGADGCRVLDNLAECARVDLDNGWGLGKVRRDGMLLIRYELHRLRWLPHPRHALALFRKHFFNRTDRVAFLAPWGDPCPCVGDDRLDGLLKSHLTGKESVRVHWVSKAKPEGELTGARKRWRVGVYGPAPDGTTRWLVIDFDAGGEHAAPLEDPTGVALTVRCLFLALGALSYLERSKSGSGWHLWVFFDPPVPAALARALAFAVLPTDATLTDGAFAEPEKGLGIEVFPKCDDLGDGRTVGSQVWLPWFVGAGRHSNVFYQPSERGLLPFIPQAFETADEAKAKSALAAAEAKAWGDL
jgi:hypothetical protein